MHKYCYIKIPNIFSNFFLSNEILFLLFQKILSVITFHIIRNQSLKQSLEFSGAKVWNALPVDIKIILSPSPFSRKSKSKHHPVESFGQMIYTFL